MKAAKNIISDSVTSEKQRVCFLTATYDPKVEVNKEVTVFPEGQHCLHVLLEATDKHTHLDEKTDRRNCGGKKEIF